MSDWSAAPSPCRVFHSPPPAPAFSRLGRSPASVSHPQRVPVPRLLPSTGPCQSPGPMALQALQSSGVAFRKILCHFPEELSLAFAYGSGVYRQAGPSSDQKVSPGRPHAGNVLTSSLCLRSLQSRRATCLLCALHLSTGKVQAVQQCS